MLLSLSDTKVYLCLHPTDMRKSFDGLSAVVQGVLSKDPFCGHLFVFRNKAGDRIKVLAWDGTGFSLFYKRLEKGKFHWPRIVEGTIEIRGSELNLLLEGMDWRRLSVKENSRPITAI